MFNGDNKAIINYSMSESKSNASLDWCCCCRIAFLVHQSATPHSSLAFTISTDDDDVARRWDDDSNYLINLIPNQLRSGVANRMIKWERNSEIALIIQL